MAAAVLVTILIVPVSGAELPKLAGMEAYAKTSDKLEGFNKGRHFRSGRPLH